MRIAMEGEWGDSSRCGLPNTTVKRNERPHYGQSFLYVFIQGERSSCGNGLDTTHISYYAFCKSHSHLFIKAD
jgi:hypothetical protein